MDFTNIWSLQELQEELTQEQHKYTQNSPNKSEFRWSNSKFKPTDFWQTNVCTMVILGSGTRWGPAKLEATKAFEVIWHSKLKLRFWHWIKFNQIIWS